MDLWGERRRAKWWWSPLRKALWYEMMWRDFEAQCLLDWMFWKTYGSFRHESRNI